MPRALFMRPLPCPDGRPTFGRRPKVGRPAAASLERVELERRLAVERESGCGLLSAAFEYRGWEQQPVLLLAERCPGAQGT